MTTPWLSVLIPVYNAAAYLVECVESVMAQCSTQDPGVELILLNDGSTDGSEALMQQLAARWPGRLQLLQQPQNGGLSAARNTMVEAAQGGMLWFLDSDDKLLPGAIASLKDIVVRFGPDLVLCDFQVWRTPIQLKHQLRGEMHRRTFEGPARQLSTDRAVLLAGMLGLGQLHAWSKIAKRTLWTPNIPSSALVRFPEGRYFEDMATMPLLALQASSWYYEPRPWVAYRQRAGSVLSTMSLAKAVDQSVALTEFRQALDASPLAQHPAVQLALAHQGARSLMGAMRYLASHPGDRTHDQAVAQCFRRNFEMVSPLAPAALERAYLLRGWWLRLAKFRRWYHYMALPPGAGHG